MADTNWINSQRSGRASMLGAAFGSGVNQGLTTILDNLAQQKAEKIRAGHLKNIMPGATDQQVSALSHLGSSVYEPALRGGFGSQQQESPITMNAQQGPQFEPKPIDFLKALAPIGLSMTPEQEKQISALPIEKQSEIADKIFSKLGDDQKQKVQQYWENPQQFAQQRQMGNQSPMQGQPQQQVLGSQQPGIAPAQKSPSVSEALQRGSNKGSERLAFEKEREKRIADQYAHKNSKDVVHNILDRERAKNEEDAILKRIIKISEKEPSSVRNPVLTGIMKDIGIDYQGLKNGDTLELDKLSNWFLRGGVKLFGGKVSNAEMYALLNSVPNALQTSEGRTRLAKQMILANKDFHDEARELKNIIKENKGKFPIDLEIQLSDRMEPIHDRNAYNFINGIYKMSSEDPQGFKVGQKLPSSDISKLPNGTIYKKNGKRYEVKDGKEVAL